MRPLRVVVIPPSLDEDLGFTQRHEDLTAQQLVTQLAIKALDVPVLPGTSRLDVQSLHADLRLSPFLYQLQI